MQGRAYASPPRLWTPIPFPSGHPHRLDGTFPGLLLQGRLLQPGRHEAHRRSWTGVGSRTGVDALSGQLQLAVALEADEDLRGSGCELWAASHQTFTKGLWWP